MKVLFYQTVHPETDDRIVHQVHTLTRMGHTCVYANTPKDAVKADIAICDTPKAIWQCRKSVKKVVYDITEWYPSKKNLRAFPQWTQIPIAIVMICMSIVAGCIADCFFLGEQDKGKPFRMLYPWKKYIYLPYYPSQRLFPDNHRTGPASPLRVLYAGPLTEEKGYFRAKRVAERCGIELTVIGPKEYMPLEDFCRFIGSFDVALDLRDIDMENRRCLPIKLFYYWAAGVVPIYSNLDAIRKHIVDPEKKVFLVNKEEDAVAALNQLICNPQRVMEISSEARNAFETEYNWESIESRLRILEKIMAN